MQEQHGQDMLSGPLQTGLEFAPMGGLTYNFLQLAIRAHLHLGELELQDFARHRDVDWDGRQS